MMKDWVVISKGTKFYSHAGANTPLGETKEQDFGFIQLHYPDSVLVRCTKGQVYFKKVDLVFCTPYQMSFSEACNHIREYEGSHRCCDGFEFNIKFYRWDAPEIVAANFSLEKILKVYEDIMENELKNLVDKDWCDGCLPNDFEWIKDYSTVGRSGGWLVLHHCDKNVDANYFRVRVDEQEEELANLNDELKEADDIDIIEQIGSDIAEINSYIDDIKEEAIDLALDLLLIDRIIKSHKENLEEYLKTDEPWQPLLDILEETNDKGDIVCPLCTGIMHYELSREGKHEWDCSNCGALLSKESEV